MYLNYFKMFVTCKEHCSSLILQANLETVLDLAIVSSWVRHSSMSFTGVDYTLKGFIPLVPEVQK